MTFTEAVAAIWTAHPNAELSPSARQGRAFARAAQVDFKKDQGGLYVGRDTDGTEVLVYFNDNANVIACTEIEPDDDE